MNITNKSKLSRKKMLAFAALAVLLIGGVVAALEKLHVINIINSTQDSSSGPTEAQKAEQKKVEQDQKKDFIESPEPTPDPQSTDNSIELSAKQESNGSVTVLTKLYNVAAGTCSLTVTNGSSSHSQTADIIYQPTFSSCAGFSVAKDKLGTGLWTIKLTTTGDSQLEKVITLKVN